MALTDQLVGLIARMEGYYVAGTLAQRNNNPGNLRAGPRAISTDSRGFAVYSSPDDGWADLYDQVSRDAGRGKTLEQFIAGYAPPSENDTGNYLRFLVSNLGVAASTRLADLGPSAADPGPSATEDGASATQDAGGVQTTDFNPWLIVAAASIGLAVLWA